MARAASLGVGQVPEGAVLVGAGARVRLMPAHGAGDGSQVELDGVVYLWHIRGVSAGR